MMLVTSFCADKKDLNATVIAMAGKPILNKQAGHMPFLGCTDIKLNFTADIWQQHNDDCQSKD